MAALRLLEVYSRSGGTMINKCLGALPNVVIISEVCSFGGGDGIEKDAEIMTVRGQAKRWYNIELKSDGFVESILELQEYCEKNNKQLIIRDWVHALFNKTQFNANPPMNLQTLNLLKQHTKVNVLAFARNAIDVWISSRQPDLAKFIESYNSYAASISKEKMPVFKYERFTENPINVMKELCKSLELEFNADFIHNYQDVKAHGDSRYGKRSRGIKENKIAPLQRKYINPLAVRSINKHPGISTCNELLGFKQSGYFSNGMTLIRYFSELLKSVSSK